MNKENLNLICTIIATIATVYVAIITGILFHTTSNEATGDMLMEATGDTLISSMNDTLIQQPYNIVYAFDWLAIICFIIIALYLIWSLFRDFRSWVRYFKEPRLSEIQILKDKFSEIARHTEINDDKLNGKDYHWIGILINMIRYVLVIETDHDSISLIRSNLVNLEYAKVTIDIKLEEIKACARLPEDEKYFKLKELVNSYLELTKLENINIVTHEFVQMLKKL